jgi:uncharacterized protein
MFVAELWRYPLKSMGGEPLDACELTTDGIPGDRVVHVEDDRGRVITARTKPKLLGHAARIGPDGEPLVDERPWRDAGVAEEVRQAAGDNARLVAGTGPERFDVLPLLVATDGAIETLGYDRRRFRPNILVGGVLGLEERTWEGRLLAMGKAVIAAVDLRQRCVMTTFDPDTGVQDINVLKRVYRELEGTFALNCFVHTPGRVELGDEVRLLD